MHKNRCNRKDGVDAHQDSKRGQDGGLENLPPNQVAIIHEKQQRNKKGRFHPAPGNIQAQRLEQEDQTEKNSGEIMLKKPPRDAKQEPDVQHIGDQPDTK